MKEYFNGSDTVRVLKINDIIQTEMSLTTRQSVSEYVKLLDLLVPKAKESGTALVLGLGGGLTANDLCKKNYTTDGVEFDDRVIATARDYFFLDARVQTIHEDARYFLN